MTQSEMNILVPQKLVELEEMYDMRVLLAVESGSRAWGFASPDSDFDVRFIYVHKPEFYLRLEERRDVIEVPVDETWDVSGWDLDKTLRLLFRANPTLYEWLNSPITYFEDGFRERIAPYTKQCFSRKNMLYHYLNTARNNVKKYLQEDEVQPKKYFYALRPILACNWVLEQNSPPPVPFAELAEAQLPTFLNASVQHLLELKMNANEKSKIAHFADIDKFLAESIERLDAVMETLPKRDRVDWEGLDEFFLKEISRS